MTLTPEQIAEGWRWHDGGEPPVKDDETLIEWTPNLPGSGGRIKNGDFNWSGVFKRFFYRIIEAHGADAEPDRPTPFPADYSELVFDDAGWSQPFLTGGVWPEWLPDDAEWQFAPGGFAWDGRKVFDGEFAIRVRRREPKRETVQCYVICTSFPQIVATIDLIDGRPDLSTLKIGDGA